MRPALVLLVVLLLLLPASHAGAAGAAYVVRSASAGLYERPSAVEPVHTLIKGQIVTVLQHRGEWLRIITENGEEGWMRESTLAVLPGGEEEESRISEASPDDIPAAVYHDFVVGAKKGNLRRRAGTTAPIVRTAEAGEIFTIVVEEGDWYQVSQAGEVVGWMHNSVGEKRESRNLPLLILDLLEGRLAYYDQFKSEASFFRRAGWFPSFFLRQAGEDLQVRELPLGGKEVLVHLSYARKDIEYRMVIDAAEVFSLPEANRTFLSDMLLSIIDLSPEVKRVRLVLWFAVLEGGGEMLWRSMGEVVVGGEAARRVSRDGNFAAALWAVLEKDTTPRDVWQGVTGR